MSIEEILFKITGVKNIHSTTYNASEVEMAINEYFSNNIYKLESIMSKFGEAHNMLARTKLSKEEYQPISSLLATAKVELFNYYYELKASVTK